MVFSQTDKTNRVPPRQSHRRPHRIHDPNSPTTTYIIALTIDKNEHVFVQTNEQQEYCAGVLTKQFDISKRKFCFSIQIMTQLVQLPANYTTAALHLPHYGYNRTEPMK